MAIRLAELPGPDDLPVTTGVPPHWEEPPGQTLSGPHPQEIPLELAQAAQVDLRRLSVIRRMPIVQPEQVVASMQQFLDTGESPPGSNCNRITQWARVGCVAWCDITWWMALFNAGFNDGHGHIQMPGVPTDYWFGDAYVPNTMRHFQSANRFSATPTTGAGEVFFWGGGEQNSHIGCFIHPYEGKGTHLNIEANWQNICSYVQRPDTNPLRKGYCIPVFAAPGPPPPPPKPPWPIDENQ